MAKKLLLALVSPILFFGVAEGTSRLVRPVSLPSPVIVKGDPAWSERYEPDDLLFWKLRPGRVENGEPFTNALGLRGPEVGDKPADEFRILSLGESSTFGWKLPYEEAYSAVLEARLGSIDGKRVRVVNAGVPAYTSFQGYTWLRERGLDLRPDAVLIYFGANDFTPVTFRSIRSAPWAENAGMTDAEFFAWRQRPWMRLGSLLLEHSNLSRMLALRGSMKSPISAPRRSRSRVPTADRRALLSDFRTLCEAHGIRFVVLIPWYREFGMHIPLLHEFAATHPTLVVDLPAKLEHLPRPRESYFLDAFHPNREGQRQIALAIEEALRARWGAPGTGGSPAAP